MEHLINISASEESLITVGIFLIVFNILISPIIKKIYELIGLINEIIFTYLFKLPSFLKNLYLRFKYKKIYKKQLKTLKKMTPEKRKQFAKVMNILPMNFFKEDDIKNEKNS